MIKYLLDNEKNTTRAIWENIFKEDSSSFLDYYYNYKATNNKILAKYMVDKNKETIVSMLHLNPYLISLNGNILKSYYIVAVATLEEHRKKGYMAELLEKSLNDMYMEGIPFTFLRPAKEEIYTPFAFEYIYNHTFLALNLPKDFSLVPIKKDGQEEYLALSNFTNAFLDKKYNVFCVRDINYIDTLYNEILSENGNIVKVLKNNDFLGYYVYWGTSEKINRAIFLDDKYTNIKETKPLVMARITNIYEFFKNFHTTKDYTISLILKINDSIIKENNGMFKLTINNNSSSIEIYKEEFTKDLLTLNINNLTSLFFGYKDIDKFTDNKNIIKTFSNIVLLNSVFIDEEV